MSDAKAPGAWLQISDDESLPLEADCPIGQLPDNRVVLPEEDVSRHHALIQRREHDEYWLVNLGSSNGTFHNRRRLKAPVLLRDGDRVQVGTHDLVFHQSVGSVAEELEGATVLDVKFIDTLLLVADIEGSSRLQHSLPLDEARQLIHAWMSKARDIVEQHHGVVNQFLGDGVFAYWLDHGELPVHVAAALADWGALRREESLGFRLALHYGRVMTGGNALGEENLHGPDVHFVFRMEQLAKQLKQSCLLSEAAADKLGGVVRTTPVGRHLLPGFAVTTLFHGYHWEVGAPSERE